MLTLKNYLSRSTHVIDWSKHVDSCQRVLLGPGAYCPPHAGHRRVFEQLAAKAQELKAKPIIVMIYLDEVEPERPLTGEQRKRWVNMIDPHKSITVLGENTYGIVYTMLHEMRMLPIGDIMGIATRVDNPYVTSLTTILGEGHPAVTSYTSYAVTPKQGQLLFDGQVPQTHQLSSSYIRDLVKNGKKDLFEMLYKDIGLKINEIRELYAEISQGMITGDINLLARGRIS